MKILRLLWKVRYLLSEGVPGGYILVGDHLILVEEVERFHEQLSEALFLAELLLLLREWLGLLQAASPSRLVSGLRGGRTQALQRVAMSVDNARCCILMRHTDGG